MGPAEQAAAARARAEADQEIQALKHRVAEMERDAAQAEAIQGQLHAQVARVAQLEETQRGAEEQAGLVRMVARCLDRHERGETVDCFPSAPDTIRRLAAVCHQARKAAEAEELLEEFWAQEQRRSDAVEHLHEASRTKEILRGDLQRVQQALHDARCEVDRHKEATATLRDQLQALSIREGNHRARLEAAALLLSDAIEDLP